jgi:hypothetical protein
MQEQIALLLHYYYPRKMKMKTKNGGKEYSIEWSQARGLY